MEQGMKNRELNFGLFSETVLGAFLVYTPGIQVVFGMQALRFVYWLPALPFAVVIFLYDETRKWIIRHHDDAKDHISLQKRHGPLGEKYDVKRFWAGQKQDKPFECDDEGKKWSDESLRRLNRTATTMEKVGAWLDAF